MSEYTHTHTYIDNFYFYSKLRTEQIKADSIKKTMTPTYIVVYHMVTHDLPFLTINHEDYSHASVCVFVCE